MAELTPLGIAVLALLREDPMHAYEMYQLLLRRGNDRMVKIRPGSLYHTVDRLAGQELVRATGTERAGNRPERTTYEITEKGEEALAARIRGGLERFVYEYPLFPVVLSEAHNLEPGDAIARLRSRAAELSEVMTDLDAAIKDVEERAVPEAFWMAADYLRAQFAAEHHWLLTTIERIENEDLPWSHHDKN